MSSVPGLICEHCATIFPYRRSGGHPNRFCSWECWEASRLPTDRFAAKVDEHGPIPARYPDLGPCFDWIGSLFSGSGYGQFWLNGTNRRAHIVAWEWANGLIPKGLLVCHRCDRPRCVRVSHLFLDTPKGNTQDAARKGRMASGDRHWLRTRPDRRRHAKGSDNGAAKLTEDDVREVRRLAADGMPQKDIAIMYGVSRATVCNIVKRKIWKHVV